MRNYASAGNKRVFTCMNCDWFRDVASGKEGEAVYTHQVYGRVSYARGAQLDINRHMCHVYEPLVKMVRRMVKRGWINV